MLLNYRSSYFNQGRAVFTGHVAFMIIGYVYKKNITSSDLEISQENVEVNESMKI